MISTPKTSADIFLDKYHGFKSTTLRPTSDHRRLLYATVRRHNGPLSDPAAGRQMPKQIKKVSVPVVPDIGTLKCETNQKNNSEAFLTQHRNGRVVCHSLQTDGYSMRPNRIHEKGCLRTEITAPLSTFLSQEKRSFYSSGYNIGDLSGGGYHRDSTGSSSSRGSSSGFESMKSSCSIDGNLNASSNDLLSVGMLSAGMKHVDGYGVNWMSGVSVANMVCEGISEEQILANWLDSVGHPEYLTTFLSQGYDLSTIARITPEDLTALGITQPTHRKLLISEIHRWCVTDEWPVVVPSRELREWLSLIGLYEYIDLFEAQGYYTIDEVQGLMWEDFEDIGINKLGHLKRLDLAIKKIKDYECYQIQFDCEQEQQHHCHRTGTPVPSDSLQGCQPLSPLPQSVIICETGSGEVSESHSEKTAVQRHRQVSAPPNKVLNTVDDSIGSDSDDYPPLPAPLACEGSIQLLRSAFHESVLAAAKGPELDTADSGALFMEIGSLSLHDKLPLASDNCNTIENHEVALKSNKGS